MNRFGRNILRAGLCAAFVLLQAHTAFAQKEPPLPKPLENLVQGGAQMRYLGHRGGLDGWIAIKGGQEQYFYVTADGEYFLTGLLFDKGAKPVTIEQVQKLQQSSGADPLDLFTGETVAAGGSTVSAATDAAKKREFKTPAEQLLSDIEASNWISLGNPDAPAIYTFIDPQCPHCHAFMEDLRRDYIDNGLLQVRAIPVGFREETRAQAAFLLAVPEPKQRWYKHLDGDKTALPVTPGINQQGVQHNLAIMQSWKVKVTPFTVYRNKAGDVKIIQGRAQDPKQILADLR